MRAVIQRVSQAAVSVSQQETGKTGCGLLISLGIHGTDMPKDVEYPVRKITQMHTFKDDQGKMNISVGDVGSQILSVSQLTLFVDAKKGNRSSSMEAARPEIVIPLYESLNEGIRSRGITVVTGQSGADMSISLVNDRPVTIIVDSKSK